MDGDPLTLILSLVGERKLRKDDSFPIRSGMTEKRRRAGMPEKNNGVYEVLSPWADADPVPLHGLTPRLDKLEGKKIGLLQNSKRAAPRILEVTEKLLKGKFPKAQVSKFIARSFSVSSLEPQRRQEFEDWLKGVDAVIAAVGD